MVQPEAVGAFENTSANEYKFRQTRGRECPGGMGLLLPGSIPVVSLRPIPRPRWHVSRSNLRGDADFLTNQMRLLRRVAPRSFALKEVRHEYSLQASN